MLTFIEKKQLFFFFTLSFNRFHSLSSETWLYHSSIRVIYEDISQTLAVTGPVGFRRQKWNVLFCTVILLACGQVLVRSLLMERWNEPWVRSQQAVHGVVERKNQTRWCFSAADVGKREAKGIQSAALTDTNKDGQPSLTPTTPPTPVQKIKLTYCRCTCSHHALKMSFGVWASLIGPFSHSA